MRIGPIGRSGRPSASGAAPGYQAVELLPAASRGMHPDGRSVEHHVLVCVAGDQGDRELIRQGRVLADLVSGRLTVLYAFRIGAGDRQRRALRDDRVYAHSVGAQLVELPVYSIEAGVAEYVRTRAITHIVLSETSSSDYLVEQLDEVDWYFVSGSAAHTPN